MASDEDTEEAPGVLRKLSIAPYSGEREATLNKKLTWGVGSQGGNVIVSMNAIDPESPHDEGEGMFTAMVKGHLSKEQARELRDALNEELEDD